MTGTPVVLDHARVVHHDDVTARSLGFANGRVSPSPVGAFQLDLRDHLVYPGLINAHDHLQLNAIPSLPHELPFANSYQWIDAFDAHRQRPDVAAAAAVPVETRLRHGGLKNLLAGTTTVAHHDPWHHVLDDDDFPVTVVRDFGWAHSLGLGIPAADGRTRYGPAIRESFCATNQAHPWMIHLAEGIDATAGAELARLNDLGCLDANTVIIHGTGLGATDVKTVIDGGAAVVWCPMSNLEMLGQTLDPRRLAAAGRLALGSDSRLTGSRDLLDELRTAAAHSDLTPKELLRIVTADASRVLRRRDHDGLVPGANADCVIVRGGSDPYATLIGTTRSAIRAVVRDGVPVIADPDFADWFAHAGVATVPAKLDGQPKLIAAWLARPEVVALEPGLELDRTPRA